MRRRRGVVRRDRGRVDVREGLVGLVERQREKCECGRDPAARDRRQDQLGVVRVDAARVGQQVNVPDVPVVGRAVDGVALR